MRQFSRRVGEEGDLARQGNLALPAVGGSAGELQEGVAQEVAGLHYSLYLTKHHIVEGLWKNLDFFCLWLMDYGLGLGSPQKVSLEPSHCH